MLHKFIMEVSSGNFLVEIKNKLKGSLRMIMSCLLYGEKHTCVSSSTYTGCNRACLSSLIPLHKVHFPLTTSEKSLCEFI